MLTERQVRGILQDARHIGVGAHHNGQTTVLHDHRGRPTLRAAMTKARALRTKHDDTPMVVAYMANGRRVRITGPKIVDGVRIYRDEPM